MFLNFFFIPFFSPASPQLPFAADVSLSQKLKEELTYEKDSEPETEPEFLKTFLKDNVWKVGIFTIPLS